MKGEINHLDSVGDACKNYESEFIYQFDCWNLNLEIGTAYHIRNSLK